ncbi:MAG: LptE family protein [Ignavibacteriales bacterium]|nr:LptE family protein [Ignavibacteriales bacterium]
MNIHRCILVMLCGMACAAGMAGCAYSFSGSSVPSHLKTVAIPLFEDQSGFGEAGLRERLTQKLTELFVNDNSLAIGDRTTADAIVEGSILAITDAPSVISPGEQVSKRRVTMTVHVSFQDMKLRKKVWERDFSNWGEYSMGAETRTVAVDQAITKITEDVLLETVSGW